MRVKVLKAFALILFLGLAGTSFGQAPYALLSMTNTWRYNQGGTNLGVPWRGLNYVDTSWPQGRGAFGYDTNAASLLSSQILTPLALSNASNVKISTYYFRTHFTLTNNPFDVTVTITNLIDDGAVFYVNSNEVQRFNMPAAPATIAYLTTASSSLDATYKTFDVPSSALVRGDNTLAVEVHNASASSLDIGFGLAATVIYPPATLLVITNQPKSTNVAEYSQATLTAGVSGSPISYIQWFHESNAIPGANTLSYALTNVQVSDGGNYTLVISNAAGAVISSPAVVGVIADTNGPVIVSADGTDTTTNISVTFSEVVLPSSMTNASSYVVTNLGGTTLNVVSAVRATATTVLLTTAGPRLANTNYLVIASVRDNSPHTNLSVSAFPVSSTISMLTENSFYYIYNPVIQYGQVPAPTNTWRDVSFNPNNPPPDFAHPWGDNNGFPGIFWFGPQQLPGAQGLEMTQTDSSTVYFHSKFNLKASPLGVVVYLRQLSDDGGIFYINGVEVNRDNMPQGPVTYATAASSARTAVWVGPTALPQVQLAAGTNAFAAELHTFTPISQNFDFAAQLTADINSYALGPVVITTQPTNTTVFEGQTATFSFNGAGPSTFQWRSNGVNIAGATNSVLTIPNVLFSMNSNRYSVVASNPSSSATSSNAMLTVLTDTNPPSLFGAWVISGTQVLASFSKNVLPATATVVGNYAITNRTGPNVSITSAVVTNGTNVILTVGTGSPGTNVLVVNNIKDTTTRGNVIYTNSAATIGIDMLVPFDAVWKYNRLGQDLNTQWRTTGYADNTWSNGMGLIYQEGSGLPAPKNTELPLTSPTGGFVTTFYFRQHLPLALVPPNTVASFSHIIDDAAIFYVNNVQLARFNFAAASVVNFNTFSEVSVDNAALVGPVNYTLTQFPLVPGDNVLATEVHQINAASSDFVFGEQYSLTALSTRFATNFPPVPPKLFIGKVPTPFTISWTNAANFQLQATPRLLTPATTVWTNIPAAQITVGPVLSTYSVNVTNKPPSYFRLKQ